MENKEQKSKIYWRSKGKALYIKGVKIAHLLNKPNDAFYFMEKSKVLLLLEDITDNQAKQFSNIPDELLYRDTKFKNQISNTTRKLSRAKEIHKDSIKDLLFTLKRNYALFKDSVNIAFPTYARMRKDIKIIDAEKAAKEILTDSTAIVSFLIHENEGYGLMVSKQKSNLFQIENVKQLQEILDDIKHKTTAPFFSEDDFKSFNMLSQKAYTMLFGKIDYELINKKRLIIIPDESIAKIPFEVLQKDVTKDPLQPNYLFYDMNMSYAFSVSHLQTLQMLKPRSSKRFLGIAPVEFKNESLVSLPNSEKEIKKINEIFSGNLLLHEKSTKKQGIKNIEEHAVIHIASHANYEENKGTWLWFYDDKLTFEELHSLQNNADLVTLTACKTLQGNEVEGEGIMSLSRGFFASGAKSVVASLWNSNDGSTEKITTHFYKQLKNKTPKDEALSLAKREYLQTHHGSETSPYYWASITLTGNTTPLDSQVLSPSNNAIWFILIGIVLMIIIYFAYKFSFSKKFTL